MFLDVSFREGTRRFVAVFIVRIVCRRIDEETRIYIFRDISREELESRGNIFLRSIINLLYIRLRPLNVGFE